MNKKQFLRSLNNVYCRLAPTKHGVGVVAVRPIPKGTDPFKYCDPEGDVLEISEGELNAADAPEEVKKMVRDLCALQDGVHFVPDYGIDAVDKSYFLNHSTKPSMVTHDKGESFVAKRRIKKGEELTVDYHFHHDYVKIFERKKKRAPVRRK